MSATLTTQLENAVIQSLALVLIGLAVYLASVVLKIRTSDWAYGDARRSALWSLAVLILLTLMIFSFSRNANPRPGPIPIRYDSGRAANQGITYLFLAAPALVIMFVRKEPWQSARVTGRNLLGSCLIGLGIGAVSILTSDALTGIGRGLNATHFWALLYYAAVGFGDEFLFRGYLQTRLVGWLGQGWGWPLASVLMAMVHMGQRVFAQGLSLPEALISCALLIPISLFMGYVMLQTGNVVAPGIAHTFADWVGIFGRSGVV